MDYSQAIEVEDGIFWVGQYDPARPLQCNAYLVVDGTEAVVLDPGAISAFPVVMRKIIGLVSPGSVVAVIACHQDPDVIGALNVFEQVATHPELRVIAHRNSARLIEHLGLRVPVLAADALGGRLTFGDGRTLTFLDTPFLHSPGAIATWDERTGALFTGDLFGAVSPSWSLYAGPEHLAAMTAWHQAYMTSNAALRFTLDRIRALGPKAILPQHGSVLREGEVEEAIAYLEQLPCGLDLILDGDGAPS